MFIFMGITHVSAQVQTGFLAQDVEAVCRNFGLEFSGLHIPENPTDNYSLSYGSFVPLLVKAMQEQQTEIDELALLIESLREENQNLKVLADDVARLTQRLEHLEAADALKQ